MLDDVITYLEMLERPTGRRVPAPSEKLALMRAEACTASFYRYLYDTVGEPWLWFERRLIDDGALLAEIRKPTIEIFVLYVRGVPAGFFELDIAAPRETKLCYFGLIPDFIGRRLGPYMLQAAIDQAWSRPLDRHAPFCAPPALPAAARPPVAAHLDLRPPESLGNLPARRLHRLRPPPDLLQRSPPARNPAETQ